MAQTFTKEVDTMVQWGIVGLGRMAEKMALEFPRTSNSRVVAVASRSRQRAEQFAAQCEARAHEGYRALIDDDQVEAIYIANPHTEHRAVALAAIAAGKAVLIEKSFAATWQGTRDIVEAARHQSVYCAEALWSRFVPAMVALRHQLRDGVIGDIRGVQGDLQAYRPYAPQDRLFAPELGGGALLDLGVYVASAVHDVLGAPSSVTATGELLPNGVDGAASMLWGYDDGASATLACGFTGYGPARIAIFGSEGYAEIDPRMHHAESYIIHAAGQPARQRSYPLIGSGHWHMLEAVSADIEAGRTESDVMPLSATLDVSRALHTALEILGVSYRDVAPATLGL